MSRFQVWYCKPQYSRQAFLDQLRPAPGSIDRTHVHLKDIEAADKEAVWMQMQGEIWSPNGEARDLIRKKGLGHTSMSVGDILVDEAGAAHIVASIGFKQLK